MKLPGHPSGDQMPSSARRLLILSLHSGMGGGEYTVYHMVRCLDRRRWEPLLMFSSHGDFARKVEDIGCATVIVPFPAVMLRNLLYPSVFAQAVRSAGQMHRTLRERGIDLVCCSDVLTLLLVAIPALMRRVPVVYSVIFFHEWLRMLLFNILAVMAVDRIVAASPLLAEDLGNRTMFLCRKSGVAIPGVDTTVFRPRRPGEENRLRAELGIGGETRIVGMAARFDPVKGHSEFVHAAAGLLERRRDVAFVVIGGTVTSAVVPAHETYRDDVVAEATQAGLGDKMHFLGERPDVAGLIRDLDLLVCPSREEGFGLTVLEALASAVPVVVTKRSGVLSVAGDFPAVRIVAPGDVPALADAMDEMLGRTFDAGPDLGALSWDRFARQMEEIFDSAVPGKA